LGAWCQVFVLCYWQSEELEKLSQIASRPLDESNEFEPQINTEEID